MDNKKVSIIVPVYNASAYIEQTIKMVFEQTYDDFELILIDDNSTDDSLYVINKTITMNNLSSKVVVIENEKNLGAASSRNAGIERALGRYIAFLDADDVWICDKLESQVEFMEKENAAFSYTSYEFGDENANPTGKVVRALSELDFKMALTRTIIFTSTVMFDLAKIKKEDIYMPIIESEDTATWWSILKKGYVARGFDKVMTIYRRPRKSLSSNKFKAIKRIYGLYINIADLPRCKAICCMFMWAFRATLRRI